MNNSSDKGDTLEDDIAFVSQAYQAAEKTDTSQDLDDSILKMAQQRINTEANTPTKPASFAWWKNQHYQGAIAASVLVVCLVYILPSSTSNMQTKNPSIAELSEPHQAPIGLSDDAGEPEQQEMQVKRSSAFSANETAELNERSALVLARAQKQNKDKVGSSFGSETKRSALSAEPLPANQVAADAIATAELIAQNNLIIENLLKLQASAEMTHQQMITEALKRKQIGVSDENSSEIDGTEVDMQETNTPYLELQASMKDNLHKILNGDSTIEIAKTYKDVLSPQEIEYFIKIAANAKQN